MDKNSIIGLALIFAILIGFAYLNQPTPEEITKQKRAQDSLLLVRKQADSIDKALALNINKQAAVASTDTQAIANRYGSFGNYASGTEQFTTLENEEIKVVFTNKGGKIYRAELKKHKKYNGEPLVLFDGPNNRFDYEFATQDAKAINSGELYYHSQLSEDKQSLVFSIVLGSDKKIEHVYSLNKNQNMVNVKLNLIGMQDVIAKNANFIDLNWHVNIPQQEKTHEAENRTTTVYYRYTNDEPDYLNETKEVKENLKIPLQWIAYKQQFFNTIFIADNSFESAVVETKNDNSQRYVKQLTSQITLPYNQSNNESYGFKFYFGSNQYKQLAALDIGAERLVPLGWGIFRWVNKYLTVNVFYWLGQYLTNMGLIIFLLTLIVKTILFPLVYRSYLSAAKMRILKPEIDEIKEKYGNDMTKTQQENMKLYRKAGVNPMGGCVPVLLQMPILIAMFQFFPSAFDLRQKAFLWSDDLSTYDSILSLPFNIPFYGDHVSLFTLLMTISTLIYTVYNNQMTGVTGQMKWMSYIMPVLFLGFFNNYASGLTYYYFVSNIFTIGQQLSIKAFVNEDKLHKQIQENKKKPIVKSGFQKKIEEMARKRGFDPDKLTK